MNRSGDIQHLNIRVMPDESDVTDPFDLAAVEVLLSLGEQWTPRPATRTDVVERAMAAMLLLGWIENKGLIVVQPQGSPIRLLLEGTWTGSIPHQHLESFYSLVPEWFAGGKQLRLSIVPHWEHARLTAEGLAIKDEVAVVARRRLALWPLHSGVKLTGKFTSTRQQVERPSDQGAGRLG